MTREEEVLAGWASRYVHALGLCSPFCHGPGSRKHRGVDALDRPPPTEDLFLLDLDQDWAGRSLALDRVVVVSFLPPDRKIGRALDAARRRLGDRVQVTLDGTTQAAVGRADLPWADVRVLPEAGTIHAKLLIVDGVAWWGSWNLSRAATKQADIVERVEDPAVLARLLAWVEEVRKLSSPVDPSERARGPHAGSAERVEVKTGDPELGF